MANDAGTIISTNGGNDRPPVSRSVVIPFRPGLGNSVWIGIVIIPQLASAWENRNHWLALINIAAIAVWLVLPCRDKQFGNGRPLFWVRQTILGIGTLAATICATW